MRVFLYIICVVPLLFSCENDLDIDVPTKATQIVIDGEIEAGRGARIAVTLSADYFSTIDSNSIRDFVVTRGKVTLTSSKGESEILTLTKNDAYFPSYVYSSNQIFGEVGTHYDLKVDFQKEVATASTGIPEFVPIDSIWWEALEVDTVGKIVVQIVNKSEAINYYRFFCKRNSKDDRFTLTNPVVISDKLYENDTVRVSFNRVLKDLQTNSFVRDDTVVFKLCTIDKEQFDFWNGYQYEVLTASNPFASSNVPIRSSVNNGLGVFGGYSADYRTVICR